MEIRQQIFDIPSSSGNASWTISGLSETPKAAMFVLIGTDSSEGYDNNGILSVGFADGTTEGVEGIYNLDAAGTTWTDRIASDSSVVAEAHDDNLTAAFSQFISGGVELTWSGSDLGNGWKVLVIFFIGDDVSAKVLRASPGDSVTTVGFTSKLILCATTGESSPNNQYDAWFTLGVCTNGTNGLTQQMAHYHNFDSLSTSNIGQSIYNGYISGQYDGGWEWITAVSNIDSSGFDLSGSNADEPLFLCLTFDNDVDSGLDTIPTSGDISNTDPGFQPSFLGLFGLNSTTTNGTWDTSTADMGVHIGAYDGSDEESVQIASKDNAGTSNETSVQATNVIHFETADQADVFDCSFDAFTSSGFDITVNTHPSSTARYFIWWVLESAGGATYNDSVAESATIDDTPSAVKVMSASVAESCTVDDAPAAAMVQAGAGSESATIDDAPAAQASINAAESETAAIDDVPSAVQAVASTDAESAAIDDSPSAALTQAEDVAETADIDDAPNAVKITTATVAETATIDESITAAEANADSVSESATIDDVPTALRQLSGIDSETADIDDVVEAQMEANSSNADSANIDDTSSAIKILTAIVLESLSIDDTPDRTSPAAERTDNETATIDDVPSVQLVAYADITESLAIAAVQTGEQGEETGIVSGELSGVEVYGVLVGVDAEGEIECSPVTGGLSDTEIEGDIEETEITGELKDGTN